ncbi:MAG TPA: hypothetical protein VND95_17365 [Stellaceae bacterium]|nr:hypothetical protein [Stellaceae bacterium]
MSVLENLLRRGRRECAERRQYLADLARLRERLRADAARLRSEVALASGADAARPLLDRLVKLEGSVGEIDGQTTAAEQGLAVAEQELRRHELAWTQRTGNAVIAERRPLPRTRRAGAAGRPGRPRV